MEGRRKRDGGQGGGKRDGKEGGREGGIKVGSKGRIWEGGRKNSKSHQVRAEDRLVGTKVAHGSQGRSFGLPFLTVTSAGFSLVKHLEFLTCKT